MVVDWGLQEAREGVASRPEKCWKLSAGQPVVRTAPARRKLTRRSVHVPSRSSGARTRRFPLHPATFRLHARRFPLPAAAVTVSPAPASGYPWTGFRFTVPVTPRGGSLYSLHPSGHRILLEHERDYGLGHGCDHALGMDALVTVYSRNTNGITAWGMDGIMVWAWILWSPRALGARTELRLGAWMG